LGGCYISEGGQIVSQIQTLRKGPPVEISTTFSESSKLKSTENLNQEPATHQKDSAGVEALASHTPLGITPAVDPLQSLTDTSRKQPATDTAPAAAAWLHNPASIEKRKTCA
jgi:hypothetical protein